MSTEIGSMSIILHTERSFHNIDIRVLKSAIQKYARRAMFSPKGLWCLIELDLFSMLESEPNLFLSVNPKKLTAKQISMNAQRIRTNMINRLVAMVSEDVGPVDLQLPAKVYQWYIDWQQQRRDPSSRKILLEFYYAIANEKTQRIRLISDLRTVFNLPHYLTEKENLHRQLLEKFQMNDLIEILYGETNRGKKKEALLQDLIDHLSKKSEYAFAYLSLLFRRNGEKLIQTNLWPYLLRHSPCRTSTEALAFFYKKLKHKEHYLYLYHAMAFLVYEQTIRKCSLMDDVKLDIDVDEVYREHLHETNRIELDSFVFDLHTGQATSKTSFALEGALVVNECRDLLNEKYRKMYQEFKVMIDDDEENKTKTSKKNKRTLPPVEEVPSAVAKKLKITTTTDEFSEINLDDQIRRLGYQLEMKESAFVTEELSTLPRGQRRTGLHKKAVFITPTLIYKGPYLANHPQDRRKLLQNLLMTRASLILEHYLKIPTAHRSILDWQSIVKITHTDQYYLKQKSIGALSSDQTFDVVTTKIEANVKILPRGSHVHRLIELEKAPSTFIPDHPDIAQASLQHFYLRYLLNIGDSGTWNILVRRDGISGVCGIDLEEIRSEKQPKSTDRLTLLFSKVSKQQRLLHQPFLDQIVIFTEEIDPNSSLADEFENLLNIDVKSVNERIQRYLRCLAKTN